MARCRFLAAAALDNARVHAENRCERLEEGFIRECDRAAVAELVIADRGVSLREEQAMLSEFQDTALGMQARVNDFVEQYAKNTKRVIDRERSDVKKHDQDLVENTEALAWHEENVVTELRRELQQARMQVSRGSGLAEHQQRQLESVPVEPMPECLGTLRMKAASDTFRVCLLGLQMIVGLSADLFVCQRNHFCGCGRCGRLLPKIPKKNVKMSSVRLASKFRWFRT